MGLGCFGPWNAQPAASPLCCGMPARVSGNAPRHRPSLTRSPRPLVLRLSRSPAGSSIRLLWPPPALQADHAGPVPLVRTGVWPQRCLIRGEATVPKVASGIRSWTPPVPSPPAWSAMATEAVVPAAVSRVGGWPGGAGPGGPWVMRPGAAGHGHSRASYAAPAPGGASESACPEGAVSGCPGAGARMAAGVRCGGDRRQVGGRAPSTLLLFPCLVGVAGASAAALGPGLPVVCLPRCLPSLARVAGHAGRARGLLA